MIPFWLRTARHNFTEQNTFVRASYRQIDREQFGFQWKFIVFRFSTRCWCSINNAGEKIGREVKNLRIFPSNWRLKFSIETINYDGKDFLQKFSILVPTLKSNIKRSTLMFYFIKIRYFVFSRPHLHRPIKLIIGEE